MKPIYKAEQLRLEAFRTGDLESLASLLANDLSYTHST
ncbi:nuclear transport factor 2 family protein [Glutamicibacter arilaitensis]